MQGFRNQWEKGEINSRVPFLALHTKLKIIISMTAATLLALCDEIFNHFPLFDETSGNIELCNSVISPIQRNPPKLF